MFPVTGNQSYLRGLELLPLKTKALELHKEHPDWGNRKLARELGVAYTTMDRWVENYKKNNAQGELKIPTNRRHTLEIQRLSRNELRQRREEVVRLINETPRLTNQEIREKVGMTKYQMRDCMRLTGMGKENFINKNCHEISKYYYENGENKAATGRHFGLGVGSIKKALRMSETVDKVMRTQAIAEVAESRIKQNIPSISSIIHPQNGFASELIAFAKTYEQYEKALPALEILNAELKTELKGVGEERDRWKLKANQYMLAKVEFDRKMSLGD